MLAPSAARSEGPQTRGRSNPMESLRSPPSQNTGLQIELDWWTHQDLNLGPLACEASALTGLSYASTEMELLRHRDARRKSMSVTRNSAVNGTLLRGRRLIHNLTC